MTVSHMSRMAFRSLCAYGLLAAAIAAPSAQTPAPSPAKTVTFAKDVAPIFQEKCQVCHRAGEVAPMSLVTYEEARPWARAIKAKVMAGEMPPWFLDKSIGIQKYKNDLSLSTTQIDTLSTWADAGAPMGDPRDMPPAKTWPKNDGWGFAEKFGRPPDLVVKSTMWTQPAKGQDEWWKPLVASGLADDRWVAAVEVRPSTKGRRIVHHAVVQIEEGHPDRELGEFAFAEFSIGSYGEMYPPDAGKLLKAGTKFRWDIHYHSVGEAITDQIEMGIYFHPKGMTPKHEIKHVPIGLTGIGGRVGSAGIDIPPNSIARHDAFMPLQKAALVENFKPHMHMRGKAMEMSVLYPDGRYETLAYVDRYNFNWHVSYVFADDAAPLLPKGAVIHIVSWHDNTAANRNNPDPNQWVGQGSRSIDEMTHAHTNIIYLSDEEYAQMAQARKKASTSTRAE